jgi:D-3-phosphoglycerate dehydrogenase
VDDAALIEALETNVIAGAALDVFAHEPLPHDSKLRQLPNVILTSHMVGHTRDMKDSFVSAGVENIARILRSETPVYVRNPDVLQAWRARLASLDAVQSLSLPVSQRASTP